MRKTTVLRRFKELCGGCLVSGVCRMAMTRIVEDHELSNPEFIRDVRAMTSRMGITPSDWLDYIYDLYCFYPGRIIDGCGSEVFLPTLEFEIPHIREWFRDYICKPVQAGATPYVRREARERVRIIATLLRAHFPEVASTWGVAGDNDNSPKHVSPSCEQ